MHNLARLCNSCRPADANARLVLCLTLQATKTCEIDYVAYDQGPECHGQRKGVLLLIGKSQLIECLRDLVSGPLEWKSGIQ